MLIAASRVVTPTRLLAPGWLRLSGAHIIEVGSGASPDAPDVTIEGTVVPGFVDMHVHGGGGGSFDAGTADAAATVVRAHLAHGTTSMVASLVTDAHEAMAAAVRELALLVDDGMLAGIHLEGPWLSPQRSGAHQPGSLTNPNPAAVDSLLAAGAGSIRMVTVAPELTGGLAAVAQLVEAGVVVGIGHTEATYDVTRQALDAGASVGTHLFNAMRPLHHREPGPVGALLDSDAYVELVADGVHLHPAVLRGAIHAKGGRSALITDAMAGAAAADGDYRLGQMAIEVRGGVARLAGGGSIAGSTLTMDAAVRYCVLEAGIDLVVAIEAATATPARILGLADVGTLESGRLADLVVLDDDLHVLRVMRRGVWQA